TDAGPPPSRERRSKRTPIGRIPCRRRAVPPDPCENTGPPARGPRMDSDAFAKLPQPPYYAVIFTSLRSGEDADGYDATAARMVELASGQPGYLGVESTRGADGF